LSGGGTGKAQIQNNVVRESSVDGIKTAAGNASNSNVIDNILYRRNDSVSGQCLDLSSGTSSNRLMCNCESSEGCEGFDAPLFYPLF
jgi:hypothetical protein